MPVSNDKLKYDDRSTGLIAAENHRKTLPLGKLILKPENKREGLTLKPGTDKHLLCGCEEDQKQPTLWPKPMARVGGIPIQTYPAIAKRYELRCPRGRDIFDEALPMVRLRV